MPCTASIDVKHISLSFSAAAIIFMHIVHSDGSYKAEVVDSNHSVQQVSDPFEDTIGRESEVR